MPLRTTRIEASHRFNVPVERAFAFITEPANWPTFWPGYVRLIEGSRWRATGDVARLVTRLLGSQRELTMTITAFEPYRLVRYTSTQNGLPDARHERHFTAAGPGFVYGLSSSTERARGWPVSSIGCCCREPSDERSSKRSPRLSGNWARFHLPRPRPIRIPRAASVAASRATHRWNDSTRALSVQGTVRARPNCPVAAASATTTREPFGLDGESV